MQFTKRILGVEGDASRYMRGKQSEGDDPCMCWDCNANTGGINLKLTALNVRLARQGVVNADRDEDDGKVTIAYKFDID